MSNLIDEIDHNVTYSTVYVLVDGLGVITVMSSKDRCDDIISVTENNELNYIPYHIDTSKPIDTVYVLPANDGYPLYVSNDIQLFNEARLVFVSSNLSPNDDVEYWRYTVDEFTDSMKKRTEEYAIDKIISNAEKYKFDVEPLLHHLDKLEKEVLEAMKKDTTVNTNEVVNDSDVSNSNCISEGHKTGVNGLVTEDDTKCNIVTEDHVKYSIVTEDDAVLCN